MLDAGASVYYTVAKDLFHVAGIYEQDDWFMIDERADRVRPLLNDEYARDFLGELLGYLSLPSQQGSGYTLSKHADSQSSMWSLIPYSVLVDDEFTPTAGELRNGGWSPQSKRSTWTTTRGKLTLDEYNDACQAFTPTILQEPYRFLDDTWIKTHHDSPLADELYRIDQHGSRTLEGRGAGLTHEDIAQIRAGQESREPVGLPGE